MTQIILVALVLLLYLKWIVVFLMFPLQAFEGYYHNHPSKLSKLLAIPNILVEKFTNGGMSRFCILQISILPSVSLRKWMYKGLGVHIAKNVIFHYKTEIRFPHMLHVGEGSIIGDHCILAARWGLKIKKNVNISSDVSIYTAHHDHRDPWFRSVFPTNDHKMEIIIEDRVWIGPGVLILPGVTIGEGAVCCGGCVVTKDVPPFAIVAGVPAHQIGERNHNLLYKFAGKSCFFY